MLDRLHKAELISHDVNSKPWTVLDTEICDKLGITNIDDRQYLSQRIDAIGSMNPSHYLLQLGDRVRDWDHMKALDYYLQSITCVNPRGYFGDIITRIITIYKDQLHDDENILKYTLIKLLRSIQDGMPGQTYYFRQDIPLSLIYTIYKEYCILRGNIFCPLCNCQPKTILTEKQIGAYYTADNFRDFVELYVNRCDELRIYVTNAVHSYINIYMSRIITLYVL